MRAEGGRQSKEWGGQRNGIACAREVTDMGQQGHLPSAHRCALTVDFTHSQAQESETISKKLTKPLHSLSSQVCSEWATGRREIFLVSRDGWGDSVIKIMLRTVLQDETLIPEKRLLYN